MKRGVGPERVGPLAVLAEQEAPLLETLRDAPRLGGVGIAAPDRASRERVDLSKREVRQAACVSGGDRIAMASRRSRAIISPASR
jgi:hypothetical protein